MRHSEALQRSRRFSSLPELICLTRILCAIKQLPRSTSGLPASQQKKKKKRSPSTKIDKYPKILEKTDRHPLVNSCALLWHRPSLEDTALEEAMIIIIKCLDGSQASGFQHLADEINKGAFGKRRGNKHGMIRETGGIPASLIASLPFASSGTSRRRVLRHIRPLTSHTPLPGTLLGHCRSPR